VTRRLGALAAAVAVAATACAGPEPVERAVAPVPAASWANDTHGYRLPVTIGAGDTERHDRPVVVPVDFGDALVEARALGRFDPETLRVVEVDEAGDVIDESVPFQFDPADHDVESGELVVLLDGTTVAGAQRYFDVYFDIVGTEIEAERVTPLLETAEGVLDEDNPSVRIETQNGTWFLRESSGGASSLEDETGADWLAYNLEPEAAGQYRGAPNAVRGRGYFHPDFRRSPVESVDAGPLRTTVVAATRDGRWRARWEIFPTFATVDMVESEFAYYLMFEGLPGGDIDPADDEVIRSDGATTQLAEEWIGDLPGEEWVAFTDPAKGRGVFVAHREEDDVVDSYRLMDNGMTVLGYGREGVTGFLEGEHGMLMGLTEATDYDEVAPLVQDALRPLTIRVGEVERNPT
jgi:hypothetical protein